MPDQPCHQPVAQAAATFGPSTIGTAQLTTGDANWQDGERRVSLTAAAGGEHQRRASDASVAGGEESSPPPTEIGLFLAKTNELVKAGTPKAGVVRSDVEGYER
jgi:hypothetical protein